MRKSARQSRATALEENEKVDVKRLGQASEVIRRVVETGQAALVTDNGVTVAAIIDARAYHALLAQQLLRDLQAAAAEADAGHLVEHKEVLRELRDRFRGRVPDSLLEAFKAFDGE
jgi:antitoxin (DNA-binding transcriptional repressor) of toxin-antitoxin stability system